MLDHRSADPAVAAARAKQDRISDKLGAALLQGHCMLGEVCLVCETVLMRHRESKNKFCVECGAPPPPAAVAPAADLDAPTSVARGSTPDLAASVPRAPTGAVRADATPPVGSDQGLAAPAGPTPGVAIGPALDRAAEAITASLIEATAALEQGGFTKAPAGALEAVQFIGACAATISKLKLV